MRVVVVTESLPVNMGYLVSMLPKYLARQGVDVHVLAIDLPPYYNLNEFRNGMPKFLQAQVFPAGTVKKVDGYTVHVQKHRWVLGYTFMTGVYAKLREIRPDVVYCVTAIGWSPLLVLRSKLALGFKLYTGSHNSATTFPLAVKSSRTIAALLRNLCTRWFPGRLVSLFSEKCYCPTSACADVAQRFFGVQEGKLRLIHLGVDTDYFFPTSLASHRAAREALRAQLGFGPGDVVCIYTGKMTEGKNALLLATAIDRMRAEGFQFRGLFIGEGVQRPAIEAFASSVVRDFMPVSELGPYYRAADIAVWLTDESTSMLDAAACGLPIIVSDRIYQEHVTGNGLAYRMNDLGSLCERLRELHDPARRSALGEQGAKKMREAFTWELAAQKRLEDFRIAVGSDGQGLIGAGGGTDRRGK